MADKAMNKLVYDQLDDIAHRFDILLDKIKGILPPPILDESKTLQLMFGDKSSPERMLVVTYLRLEPLLRFCEQELIPAVEEEAAKSLKKEKPAEKQATKSAPTEKPKAMAQ